MLNNTSGGELSEPGISAGDDWAGQPVLHRCQADFTLPYTAWPRPPQASLHKNMHIQTFLSSFFLHFFFSPHSSVPLKKLNLSKCSVADGVKVVGYSYSLIFGPYLV